MAKLIQLRLWCGIVFRACKAKVVCLLSCGWDRDPRCSARNWAQLLFGCWQVSGIPVSFCSGCLSY